MGPSAACNSACHNSHRHPPGHLVRPKTAGPWRPSHRLGPTIVSSSRSTADFPTPVRMESSGGTSSTPHTQNFERSASLPPSRPSPSPRAVTCPSGPATLRGTTRTSLDADHPASSRVHRPLPSLSAKRACLAMSAVEPIPRDQVGQGAPPRSGTPTPASARSPGTPTSATRRPTEVLTPKINTLPGTPVPGTASITGRVRGSTR